MTRDYHKFRSLLLFMLFACTSGKNSEKILTDSTFQDSTLISENLVVSEPNASPDSSNTSSDNIKIVLDQCRKNINDSIDNCHTITISTSQYEASSSVIWHFDNNFSPRYFKDDWAMEGTEGSTEYFIDRGELQCTLEYESFGTGNSVTSWCKVTGGILTTHEDESGNDTTEFLPANYSKQVDESFNRYLSALKTLLKEGKIEDESNDPYLIKIENKPYEGDEFIEVTEISIPRELYKGLMN